MKKITRFLGAAILAGAGIAGIAGPAAALENPVDIIRILPPPRVAVTSSDCKPMPVRYVLGHVSPLHVLDYALVNISRGGQHIETDFVDESGTGVFVYCPGIDGIGRLKYGPSTVYWHFYDGDLIFYAAESPDRTTAYTDIRNGSSVRANYVRRGSRVTVTATTRRYRLYDGYVGYRAPRVLLQQLRGGTWHNVGDLAYLPTGNMARASFTAPTGGVYRVATTNAATVWGSRSKGVRP
jgi:hypothetical protein